MKSIVRIIPALILSILAVTFISCAQKNNPKELNSISMELSDSVKMVTFGAGCFWCTEAVFQRLNGVVKVVSGYSGGHVKNPSYREVCMGNTGHAEVCQVYYNPEIITYTELLEVFWKTHDPTTLNRQGNDVGPQYRSVIFYHEEEQKALSESYKKKLNESGAYENPVITEIEKFKNFYIAEDYHQNYYNLNGSQPYCTFVIEPKLEKFEKVFNSKLKKDN